MEEIINPDEHSAEIAALQHEIYRLNSMVKEKEEELLKRDTVDLSDPFENPTDYKEYSGSYTDIQPRLGELGYSLPLEPDQLERRKLRKYYSIGGWCMVFQFIFTFASSVLLMQLILIILQTIFPDKGREPLYNYMRGSSILVGLNMLVYLTGNVLNTFIGLKWAKIKGRSLIQTRNYTFGKAIQYCFIALMLWTAAVYAGSFVEQILNKFGMTSVTDQTGLGESPLGIAVNTLYTCIIAPVTEELLFRGMLLKVFSKANQRFAVFATAFFFGMAHGNIPQFILALFMGIFLAHITLRHNSIIPAIIVHMFVNTFSTLFGLIDTDNRMLTSMFTLMLFACAIIGIIMLAVFRSDGGGIPSTTPKQSRRGIDIALASLPFLAAVFIHVLYMMLHMLSKKA